MPQWRRVDDDAPAPMPVPAPGAPTRTFRRVDEAAPADEDQSRWGDYLGMLIRGGSGFLGNAGGLVGAVAGGGGDLLAQTIEQIGGSRKDYSLEEAGAATALGAIPFGKAASLVRSALKGAALGGASAGGTQLAKEFTDDEAGVDLGRVTGAAVPGVVLGAAGGGGAHLLGDALSRAGAARTRARDLADDALDAARFGGPQIAPDVVTAPGTKIPLSTPTGAVAGARQGMITPPPADLSPLPVSSAGGSQMRPTGIPGEFEAADDPLAGLIRTAAEWSDDMGGRGARPFDRLGTAAANRQANRIAAGMEGQRSAGEQWQTPTTPRVIVPDNPAPVSSVGPGRLRRIPDVPGEFEIAPLGPAAPPPPVPGESLETMLARLAGRQAPLPLSGDIPTTPAPQAGAAAIAPPAPTVTAAAPPQRPARTPNVDAIAPEPVTFIPREQEQAYREIIERQARAAMTTGQEQPGLETLIAAVRRWQEEPNPRRLWGIERRATEAARNRVGRWMRRPGGGGERQPTAPSLEPTPVPMTEAPAPAPAAPAADTGNRLIDNLFGNDGSGGEGGYVDPALLQRLGLHLGSAAGTSAAAGLLSDDENRGKNMIGGAIVGGALPLGGQKLAQLRYFSMLANASPQLANVGGAVGATVTKAAEEALTGNTAAAQRLLAEVFSPETARRVVRSFQTNVGAQTGDTRWGQTAGVLGLPSRAMHAVDEGVTESMRRGGLSTDDAQLQLFTSDPRSEFGKWVANRPGRGFGAALMPFVRTGTNLVERGLEHTPGVGMIPAVKAMRPGDDTRRRLARQGLGAAAIAAGAAFGEPDRRVEPLMGPLALPYTLGAQGRKAAEGRGDDLTNVVRAVASSLRRATPLPTDTYSADPGRYLASYVPGFVRDANLVDPNSFRTSDSIFDPTIAKIPVLNEAVLRRRVRRPRRVE